MRKKRNFEKIEQLRRANSAESKFLLGKYFSELAQRDKNQEKDAIRWYIAAAKHGHLEAHESLWGIYMSRGTASSNRRAREWYEKAWRIEVNQLIPLAESGNTEAQRELGQKYDVIDAWSDRIRDSKKAVFWLRAAAKSGDRASQYHLGCLYKLGRGVRKNYRLALKWCLEAAKQGNNNSMEFVADAYAEGRGIAKDSITAAMWYFTALATCNDPEDREDIMDGLNWVLRRLTPANVRRARHKSMMWLSRNKLRLQGRSTG